MLKMIRNLPSLALIAGLSIGLGLATPVAAGMKGDTVSTNGHDFVIELNEGKLIRLDQEAESVFIANPAVADISVKSPKLIYLFGKAPGETSLFALDANENVIANMRVVVTHNLSRLQTALDRLVPNGNIVPISIDSGIILTGGVPTATEAEDARRLATHFIAETEEIINQLRITAPNQVNLRVRFAEVSREISNNLGFDFSALYAGADFSFGLFSQLQSVGELAVNNGIINGSLGNNFDLNLFIDALASDNLVTLLAEPNLTALSGETASFLAGGEFPIPVDQGDDSITIEFKQFGVSLAFTPTIIGENRISMRVRPEVSAIASLSLIPLTGFSIPTLSTRRAETTVELGSGQSFAIAGLFQDNTRQAAEQLAGLADLPILGALFRSEDFQRNESELVIIVTPYIVKPVNANQIVTPLDGFTRPQSEPGLVPVPTASASVIPLNQNLASQLGSSAGAAGFIVE